MQIETEETIRTRAYALWEQAGRPDGLDQEFWHRAERELAEQSRLDSSEQDTDPRLPPLVAGRTAH
jgi:hypothetical protein